MQNSDISLFTQFLHDTVDHINKVKQVFDWLVLNFKNQFSEKEYFELIQKPDVAGYTLFHRVSSSFHSFIAAEMLSYPIKFNIIDAGFNVPAFIPNCLTEKMLDKVTVI